MYIYIYKYNTTVVEICLNYLRNYCIILCVFSILFKTRFISTKIQIRINMYSSRVKRKKTKFMFGKEFLLRFAECFNEPSAVSVVYIIYIRLNII